MKYILFAMLLPVFGISQEICNNGIDDDNNGLIDLNDTACVCNLPIITQPPSLLPNPSFELYNCCPTAPIQANCSQDWYQATGYTSDYFNTCGYVDPMVTQPMPHGNGVMGTVFSDTWQEYIGACLTTPLQAGVSYTLQFYISANSNTNSPSCIPMSQYSPADVTLFGNPSCNSFPILPDAGATGWCPSSINATWVDLGFVSYQPISNWTIVSITFTPAININSIAIGQGCTPITPEYHQYCTPYFAYDNMVLNVTDSFPQPSITQIGNVCANNSILIADADISGGAWQWYLDGIALVGETDSILNISTNNYGTGNYTAFYTLNGKCVEISEQVIQPSTNSNISFNVNPVCVNNSVLFIENGGSNNIVNWQWNFGDGNTSVGQSVSHQYNSSNTYNITLIVTDSAGCTDTIAQPVTINPAPNVGFQFNDACIGLATQFTDTTNNAVDWQWNFGNGNFSSIQNPNTIYNNPGNYTVTLIAITDSGCTDSTQLTLTIADNPTANFTATEACLGDSTFFTDLSSGPNPITTWNWTFNNGNSTMQDPSNIFNSSGTNLALLEVIDVNGCTDTISKSVLVHNLPNVVFMADTLQGCSPLCVNFSDNTNSTDVISTWNWNFGDGNTSNNQNLNHCFTNDGDAPLSFDISLTATTINGCSNDSTALGMITVYPIPTADFTFSPEELDEYNTNVSFNDQSYDFINSWSWNFGNGNTSTSQNPTHDFNQAGEFDVLLIVTNAWGCINNISKLVEIKPVASLYVPNAFTPDGDGINDIFKAIGRNIEEFDLMIFDRWGEIIFSSDQLENGWNGAYKGALAPNDVYVWKIKAKDELGKRYNLVGKVTLVN